MDAERQGVAAQGVLHAFVGAFVDELARSGVRNACLCPGSRSTPLALLLRKHQDIQTWVHIDERSAGFFGLGMAKALGEPIVLVSTSGTAAMNFAPAVVEARYARVPLLVLTADRPPELRDVGANQTIDQVRLFGVHVKASIEVPLPEASKEAFRYVRTLACRAAATARSRPFGPVHLNFPFREPLVPMNLGADTQDCPREARVPYVSAFEGPMELPQDALKGLAAELGGIQKGLIVLGPQDDPKFPSAVIGLGQRLGFPILCDPLSQVRSSGQACPIAIDAYDTLLRHERTALWLSPDLVLRFGATPTSKTLLSYLQRLQSAPQVFVDGGEGWSDPGLSTSRAIQAHPRLLVEGLSRVLGQKSPRGEYANRWVQAALAVRNALKTFFEADGELSEPWVLHALADGLPDDATMFIGNSMPVRDLDTFFFSTPKRLRLLANRGASGIDGVVSSALGAAAALCGPVVLVVGDLSFYHDMNGLLAAKRHGLCASIVLLNNDGGGIFSFLPQVKEAEHFDELFGTPHGLDFRHVAELYGLSYQRPASRQAFLDGLKKSLQEPGVSLLEVCTERRENHTLHRELALAAMQALDGLEKERTEAFLE